MSWKGAIRSMAATARRMEREQQRRARIATQQYKQLQKEQAIASASKAVAEYNELATFDRRLFLSSFVGKLQFDHG